jgi:fibronectin-binding autotransporter adhesin
LQNGTSALGLTKTGTGTLTLSGASTYSGATNIAAGTLQAGAVNTFSAASAFTVGASATLDLNGFNQTLGSLAGAGTVNVGTNNLTVGGDNTSTAFSGTINMTNQGYSPPYGTFTKTGSGTLTIDNATITQGESYITQGAMAQTSGNTTVTYLAVGTSTTAGNPNVGALNVSGGTISFGTGLQVGDFGGQGTLNQTGGTVRVEATCGDFTHCAALHIGNQGGTGAYNISGGELDLVGGLNELGRSTGTHPASAGTFNISGGVVDLSSNGAGGGALIIGYGNESTSSPASQ